MGIAHFVPPKERFDAGRAARTTARQARAQQGVSRGRGPPDMEADHARHGTGVSAKGGAHLRVQLINMKVLQCGQ